MTFLLASAALAADCPAPVDVAGLEARLAEAEGAWTALDAAGATSALDHLGLELPCLDAPLPPAVAARVHRLYALVAWGEGREADARRSLASMRRIDPAVTLPQELVPPGHALHAALAEAKPSPDVPIAEPRGVTLLFDGADHGAARPLDPTVAQLLDGDEVRWTVRLAPTSPLPEYPAVPVREDGRKVRWKHVAATGTGLLAVGLYGGAWLARASFENYVPDPLTPGVTAREALDARRATTTGLVVGSGLSALATVGLVVVPL